MAAESTRRKTQTTIISTFVQQLEVLFEPHKYGFRQCAAIKGRHDAALISI